MPRWRRRLPILFVVLLGACGPAPQYDLVIRNGLIYDGRGRVPSAADLAVDGDTIAALVPVESSERPRGRVEIEAGGLAVAPGFINMLSWATASLLIDGRSQSDVRQGVTLEVFGEGMSMGPLNDVMKEQLKARQGDLKYDVDWTTLAEYLDHLVAQGVSPNVASFVGATTVRVHVLGYEDRAPTPEELDEMRQLVRRAMTEGALGVGSSLIYAPAFYADTQELVELCKVAAELGGMYISHIRSEGERLVEAVDELISIARQAGIRSEIYHLKAAGKANWEKLDEVIARVEAARAEGLAITADIYTYPAGATGLNAAMPPWAQEGGHRAWLQRLKDPETRARIKTEMLTPTDEWENLFLGAGSPDNILLVGFRSDELKPLTGKSLAEVAELRGEGAAETAMNLVVEDDSRVEAVYFLMSEENLRKKISLPWVSLGSDAGSMAPEGPFLQSSTHPRAYGNFARFLGKYVRDEGVIPLREAIRRLTSLPAENLKLTRRGSLEVGNFADIVVFDPDQVADHATFQEPHRYSVGMTHVFVNGVAVLKDGEHTGAKPGRVVRGPGWKEGGEPAAVAE